MILANVSVLPCFMVAIRSPIISNCSSVRVEYVFGVPPGCKRILIVELFGELRIRVLGAEGAGRRVGFLGLHGPLAFGYSCFLEWLD